MIIFGVVVSNPSKNNDGSYNFILLVKFASGVSISGRIKCASNFKISRNDLVIGEVNYSNGVFAFVDNAKPLKIIIE